jgi:hypothetical protein
MYIFANFTDANFICSQEVKKKHKGAIQQFKAGLLQDDAAI